MTAAELTRVITLFIVTQLLIDAGILAVLFAAARAIARLARG